MATDRDEDGLECLRQGDLLAVALLVEADGEQPGETRARSARPSISSGGSAQRLRWQWLSTNWRKRYR